jgi:beta-lactamase regulating signal transducer with metallopeptidase domain
MSELLDWVEGVGRAVPGWVVRANVEALVLLAGVVLADVLLARRVSAAWRMMLYALVPLRVLVPFAWPGAMSMVGGGVARMSGTWTFVGGRVEGGATGVMGMTSGGAAEVGSQGGVWGVWVAGAMVAVVGVLVWSWWRGVERLARAIRVGAVGERVREGVVIVEHTRLGPLVAGVLKPRVVLPEGLARSVGEARAEWVERHEIRHVKRGDPVVAFGVKALCVLCWPVVAIWLAAARVRTLMEQACDEATVAGGDARGYGEALLVVSARAGGVSGGTSLAFGAGVRGRIAALAERRRWSAVGQALAVLGAGLLLAACAGEGSARGGGASSADEVAGNDVIDMQFQVIRGSIMVEPEASGAEGSESQNVMQSEVAFEILKKPGVEASTLSAPRIRVVEGQPARIMVGAETADGEMTEGIEVMVEAQLVPGGVSMKLRYRERGAGREAIDSRSQHVVPEGKVLIYTVGGVGDAARTIVVQSTVVPRAGEVQAEGAGAKFMTMVNIMSTTSWAAPDTKPLADAAGEGVRRLLVTKDAGGVLRVGPDDPQSRERVKGAWAVAASDGVVLRMMDSLRENAGGSVSAVPAVVTEAGQEAQVRMTDTDKAHASVGRDLSLRCDLVGGGIGVSFRGKGEEVVEVSGVTLAKGESVLVFVLTAGGRYEVYAVRPALLGGETQVHQTAEGVGESPRGR